MTNRPCFSHVVLFLPTATTTRLIPILCSGVSLGMDGLDSGGLVSSSTAQVIDVFGTVEPIHTPKPHPVLHTREQPIIDSSPPSSPLFAPPIQPVRTLPSRTGSRRTQSVDVVPRAVPRQPAAPSLLGPARRKRGERERERDGAHERNKEKDSLRAELDASTSAVAPGLALGTSKLFIFR